MALCRLGRWCGLRWGGVEAWHGGCSTPVYENIIPPAGMNDPRLRKDTDYKWTKGQCDPTLTRQVTTGPGKQSVTPRMGSVALAALADQLMTSLPHPSVHSHTHTLVVVRLYRRLVVSLIRHVEFVLRQRARHSQIVSVSCARSSSPPLEDRTLHRAPIHIHASCA
eukprot:4940054-Prymnesium_polylepis.1